MRHVSEDWYNIIIIMYVRGCELQQGPAHLSSQRASVCPAGVA